MACFMTSQTVGSSKTVFGIFMMLGFAAFGPTIDVFAKLAGQSGIAVFQISAARFAIQALALLPFALFLKSLHLPDRAETGLYILRGGLI